MPARIAGGLLSFISVILGLVSCAASERVYSGDLGGERVVVSSLTSRNPFDHSVTPVLQVGNLPKLEMRYESTTIGVPYSPSIYASRRTVVLDAEALAAYGSQRASSAHRDVVLYLDPARFNQEQFDRYARFFAEQWPGVQAGVPLSQGLREIRPVALVHGTDSEFVRKYRHPADTTGHIEVWTDGMVNYVLKSGSRSTNLGQWVQMPGYRITVGNTPNPFALADIHGYVDADGRSIGEDFKLVVE